VKEVRRPLSGLTRAQIAAVALEEQAFQPPRDIVIDLPKLDGGIARAEVGTPATQHRVELRESLAQVPMTDAERGAGLHALANPTHGAARRPPLEVVHPSVCPFPQPAAHALAHMTAEEVKALASPREVDLPRFVWM
jgi:hypothetical protein